jgi:DNA-3-methyladenine glycosylase I
MSTGLVRGEDGKRRCWWAVAAPEYVDYHDREWGRPVVDDRGLFERMCLEAFQSGLSWLTILRKREGIRAAFAGFHIERVAGFGQSDVPRLLADPRIIRNRAKVDAAIHNAGALLALREEGGSLAELVWGHRPRRRRAPRAPQDLAAVTSESAALARELRRRDLRFVGPTTAYALMQACGLVNDHLAGCYVRSAVERDQREAVRELPRGSVSAEREAAEDAVEAGGA